MTRMNKTYLAALITLAGTASIAQAEDVLPAIPAKFITSPSADLPSAKKQEALVKVVEKVQAAPDEQDSKSVVQQKQKVVPVEVRMPAKKRVVKPEEGFSKKTYELEAGRNMVIPIAVNFGNRIITPFNEPKMILANEADSKDVNIVVKDNVLYVYTELKYPVAGYIINGDDQRVAISVTLLPKELPPREVTLTLKEQSELYTNGAIGSKKANKWEKQSDYYTVIRNLFRSIALDEIPNGYTISKTLGDFTQNLPNCRQEGLGFNFYDGQTMTGHNIGVFIGIVENTTNQTIEFKGENCAGWGIKGVTSWPHTFIEPGQKSEVYVAYSIDRTPSSKRKNMRRSLLAGEQ